uniref:F-box domain-containing protein n=1 Tax=Stomoxys calcitrans TaxID=35570 RepID=A0A1I8Q9V8_STOCA
MASSMEPSQLSAKQILNNSLVLENICHCLNFKEQLKAARVCKEFRETIVQFIWRSSCKDLVVSERDDTYMVTLNQTQDYCLGLKDFLQFFHLNRRNVQKLILKNCNHRKLRELVEQLEHLTYLEMQYCKIAEKTIEELAKNCKGLKTLTFDRCLAENCNSELILGHDLTVDTLVLMSCLEELNVYNRHKVKMKYETLWDIVRNLRLTKLSLNSSIFYEGSERIRDLVALENYSQAAALNFYKTLESLDIGRFSNRASWLLFVKLQLPHFRNLQSLSIFIDLANCVLINDSVATLISDACPRLRKLCFKQCKFQLQDFSLPVSLEHLCLVWCWGITWQNLQQILQDYPLEELVSLNGHYDGDDGQCFYHSESLQSLTIETSLIKDMVDIFSSTKSLFPQVTTLKWLNSSECCYTHPQEMRYGFSKIFPRLQELLLEQAYLPAREFEQLICLQSLQISLYEGMSWPYLLTLLKSSSLQQLKLEMPTNIITSLCPVLTAGPDWHMKLYQISLTRNLKLLEMPLKLLQNALPFWLDLLHHSQEMKLKFYDWYSHKMFNQMFVQTLLNAEKFPSMRRTIDICNNKVDCQILRKNIVKTMESYEFHCNSRGHYFIEI